NTNGVTYSVTNRPGYTYTWTITGGTQASGGTSSSITVDWGSPGVGKVSVSASTGCGTAAIVDLNVTIFGNVISITSGDWNVASTWDCNCNPADNDNAIIDSSHTVTVTADEIINNLTIYATATLQHNATRQITVNGDYTNSGTHDGGGDRILLDGAGNIDGIGTVTNVDQFRMMNGNKTVLSSANLTINPVAVTGEIRIENNITVTNNGIITFGGDVWDFNGSENWVNGINSTVYIGGAFFEINGTGTLNASATGNAVRYNGAANQNIKVPTSSYYDLFTEGSNTKTLAGSIIVANDLNIVSTLDVSVNNYNINLGADWINTGALAFAEQSGTVTIDGTANQTITNVNRETFFNFTINKSSGTLTINDDVTVSNTLTMTSGNISTGTDTLILGTGTGNVGTLSRTGGTVVGYFKRWFNTIANPAPVVLFPVGTSTSYRPAEVEFNALSNGALIADFVATSPGTTGLPLGEVPLSPADSIRNTFTEGYWHLKAVNTLSSTTYDLELTGTGFTSYTINASTRILKRATGTTTWTLDGAHANAVSPEAYRDALTGGISDFEFCFGDTSNCTKPVTPAITGADSVCISQAGVAYSVTPTGGSTYNWTITAGLKASGGTGDNITVDWGATGGPGNVQVVETNSTGCTGDPVNKATTIHTVPTSSITGSTNIEENTTGEPYSVTNNSGYTYTWTITGGTQASGGTTNSITVDWGSPGVGNVRVVASTGCNSAAPVDLAVTVYGLISNTGTGDWSLTTTWDCACVPVSTSSVKIIQNSTVTLDANNITISNLTIDTNGTLFDDNFLNFTVTGNLTIHSLAIYSGSQGLTLSGANKTIAGTGRISASGTLSITGGNKTISSGANLNRSPGDVDISAGVTLSNDGSIIIAGDLTGAASSIWTNTANSAMTVGGALLSTGTLNATATGNTVTYNGTVGQSIKPVDYYNVTTTGVSTSTLGKNTIVYGNVNVGASNTLNANGFNMNVRGNWTNTGGTFTAGTGTVTFDGTGTQTITNAAGEQFNHLTIAGTSTVQTAGASDNINVLGNWTNNGTFTQQTGKVTLNGSSAQTIGGGSSTSFNDLELNNASGATVSVPTNMIRTLTLTSGTFTTGGLVTFISNASGTGNIGEITGGAISGNITMQRYIAGDDDWRLLGSPVNGTSLLTWNDDFTMSGFPGSNGPGMSFISVSSYNETATGVKENGYVTPSGIGDGLGLGKGWFLWIGQNLGSAITMNTDLVGDANTGPISVPTSYTTSGGVTEDGWNLIANPYPSDILWDLTVSTTNLTPFAYVWDPNGDSYVSYDQAVGTSTIPSTQAFWVKNAAAGPGSVDFIEANKTVDGNNFYKTYPIPGISLILTGNNFIDSTRIRLVNNSTYNYDPMLDAFSMYSLNAMKANISTVSADPNPIDLSINSMPELDGDVAIPVRVGFSSSISGSNTYTITANLNTVPQGSCVLLEDIFTGTFTDLIANNSYQFTQAAGVNLPPRFLLHISAPLETEITDVSCNGYDDAQVVATAAGTSLTYTWYDANNDTLSETMVSDGSDSLIGLSPGNYSVIAHTSSSICPIQTQLFTITEPAILTSSSSTSGPMCFGDSTGSIDLLPTGGTVPYQFQWSDGSSTEDLVNIWSGDYHVTIT
ncbi:MAG: hypothetical protein JKX73_02995, partial [Flavobacteriales bacterium]|nr:hypothetical protein [Flavobacteriales bacterium]